MIERNILFYNFICFSDCAWNIWRAYQSFYTTLKTSDKNFYQLNFMLLAYYPLTTSNCQWNVITDHFYCEQFVMLGSLLNTIATVHKVCHAKFGAFWLPPSSCHALSQITNPKSMWKSFIIFCRGNLLRAKLWTVIQ